MESPSQFFSAKGVDFPSCENVVKMIVIDLDTLGYHGVVFQCDSEPSILSLLSGEGGLDWRCGARNVC